MWSTSLAGYRVLYDFCHLPYDDSLLAEVFERNDFARNYTGGEDKFRRGARVGNWQTRFGGADVVQFLVAAGRALVELGYEPDYRWALRRLTVGRWGVR
ncbi:MAG TPA: hypothetical protein VF152_05165 [Acidimicrobiia bacterium]